MAAAAQIVGGAKLDQQATITTNHFPGIDRGKSGSHLGLGGARAGFPKEPKKRTKLGTWFQTCSVICGTSTVDVK
ncbi:hypothetical protein SBA7_940002 [Candidatus Sulfotelmatobacter sp. SbA7]|nr:hypothetical protein SBA7_940002 [Candidatus Sulfotelmatobacter sp. SbA7]